jgi:preprotein translocase subunit YajC
MTLTVPLLLQISGGGGFLFQLIPIFMMIGVFYFLIILPQRKRQRELQELIGNLKAGDRIVTTGGVIATITAVRDASLVVRTADKSMLEITRGSVVGLHGDLEEKK